MGGAKHGENGEVGFSIRDEAKFVSKSCILVTYGEGEHMISAFSYFQTRGRQHHVMFWSCSVGDTVAVFMKFTALSSSLTNIA